MNLIVGMEFNFAVSRGSLVLAGVAVGITGCSNVEIDRENDGTGEGIAAATRMDTSRVASGVLFLLSGTQRLQCFGRSV